MGTYLKPALAALAVTFVAGSALAWYELTDSTSDSTTTTTDVTTDDVNRVKVAQQTFLKHNYASVMRDAAVGGGEYLGAFGVLLGCSKDVQPRLFRHTKLNHQRIFVRRAGPEATLAVAKRVIAEDAQLASSCRHVASVPVPVAP